MNLVIFPLKFGGGINERPDLQFQSGSVWWFSLQFSLAYSGSAW